ncbi:macro domain-containing protein [Neobacillus sp. 3P2-tot-E-2]|uniref:macro domain-containing protein n=1 Tax=Neobacillus sp. 3P2-tot-E-2 TaxID=3132212 RepID=UPI0039A1945C
MPLEIVRNDITKIKVDAIVNAANPQLKMGGGVCGAIYKAAGSIKLQQACERIGHCPVGHAVITEGFNLPANYIIHTPGPIWEGGSDHEAELLKDSYKNSLELASRYQCESIAFPLISTGIYGYPNEKALHIAVSTISQFLLESDMKVYLVVFDKKSFGLSQKLFATINEYIDEHYVEETDIIFNRRFEEIEELKSLKEAEPFLNQSLIDMMNHLEESFSERLLSFIDEKGMTDVETYKRANIDRRLFSKIRNEEGYNPKKKTVLAFAIALKLTIDETNELLSTAGYTLSRSSKFDVIIEYFINERNYNIHGINEALFSFDQPLLGA